MNWFLKQLSPSTLILGKLTERDLFDARGQLLLTKGKVVDKQIMDLLLARKIFVLDIEDIDSNSDSAVFSTELYRHSVTLVQRTFTQIYLSNSDLLQEIFSLVDGMILELETNKTYVDFNYLRTYDNNTYIHSVNVCLISTLIGLKLSFDKDSLKLLALLALFHDIGKLQIPLEILNKPAALSEEEYVLIKLHPINGVNMLKELFISTEAVMVIGQHHERWNGSGYPLGISGNDIYLNAQIIAVADVFDALIADRPYRKGFPLYYAFEMIIAGTSSEYSPKVVDAFRESIVLYPHNSLVKLNSGESGIVISVPENYPSRPVVKVLFDREGKYFEKSWTINLLEDLTRFIADIDFNSTKLGGKKTMAKVLIVDDEMFMRLVLREFLKKTSYMVIGEASNGIEAVEKYKELNPDIVTMDITMPIEDGIRALERILKIDEKANIIMCSALGQEAKVKMAIGLGAKDFILKPFEPRRVISAMDKITRKK
ncbi:MAG: HD domain-containing phosphohydrolase [Desulfitobacteriaceae bacterium]